MKKLQNCYNVWDANYACDFGLEEVRLCIKGKFVDIYTSGELEGTEDDLAEIPKVLESLNEQWQESTEQGVLCSERFQKKIERNAKVKGQRPPPHYPQPQQQLQQLQPPQLLQPPLPQQPQPAAEAAAQDTVAPQHPAPWSAVNAAMQQPPQPRAAAAGGEGGGRGGGERHVGADARHANLPAQVNSFAIDAGGKGKGKEKAAEGDGEEEEEEEVADSEEEGVQKSGSMRKHVAGASESGKSKGSVVRPRTGNGKRGAGGGQAGSKDEFETACWDCKRGEFAQKHRTRSQCRLGARHTACDWRKDDRELARKRDKEETQKQIPRPAGDESDDSGERER